MAQYFLQVQGSNGRHNLHAGLNAVGRNPTNDVRLTEASVSSFHCEIEVDQDRVLVRDLQSTNGTRLNNALIETAELRAGDDLALGEVRLQLDCEGPATVVLPPATPAADAAPGAEARYRCNRCQKVWEALNLKLLKVGTASTEVRFCPACSGRCSLIDPRSAAPTPLAEPSFLNRMTQAIKTGTRTKLRRPSS